jgi:hypothetical protein
MAKFIRYTLATVFFAAGVGCLALWWRSMKYYESLTGPAYVIPRKVLYVECCKGNAAVTLIGDPPKWLRDRGWNRESWRTGETYESPSANSIRLSWIPFGAEMGKPIGPFPLWYPALVFALAGVAALRFRRQFSIRSALVAVSVVAALLGMVVAL